MHYRFFQRPAGHRSGVLQGHFGFANDFIYAETQEEARLMVIGNRGFLPVEAVGKLPEVSGTIKRIPLYRKNRRVTRKYCLFWQEERTGYFIEEFAEMLRKRLS